MKISERQLLVLIYVLKDTIHILTDFGGLDVKNRVILLNELMNQQSNDLFETNSNKINENIIPPKYISVSEGYNPNQFK